MSNNPLSRRDALSLGLCGLVPATGSAAVAADQPPRAGDLLAFADAPRAGAVIRPGDVALNAPPIRAWPLDPASRVVRDRSRLNQILLVRLAADQLSVSEAPLAAQGTAGGMAGGIAGGIVAYSAICVHAGCLVAAWKAAERHFLCPCHGSVYDPADRGRVVMGPAARPLPALPLTLSDSTLTVAGGFTARIGGSTGRTD